MPPVAEAEQQRRAVAGDDDAVLAFLEHGDGIGAGQPVRGQAHGLEQVGRRLQRFLNQVGDDFGVGVGSEDVALGRQFLLDLGVVLDDAVMHDGQAAGDVRMGIAFGGHAMGRPARVGDAGIGGEALRLGGQFGDAADAAQARRASG